MNAPSCIAEVKNKWSYTILPQYANLACRTSIYRPNRITQLDKIQRRYWGNTATLMGKYSGATGEIQRRYWGNTATLLGKYSEVTGEIERAADSVS
jgi:hypothetical protein